MTDHEVDDDARLRVYELRQEPFTAHQAWLDQVQAFRASAERIFQVVAGDPWDQWNERPIDVFHLTKP